VTASGGPSVTIERMVEWQDTDAAGHYHHATVIRWVEAAEAALHEELGLPELFGVAPRVRYEVDYLARLWFRDRVQITLRTAHLGRTSVRYEFTVARDGETAASGAMVCVLTERAGGGTAAWPDRVRTALGAGVPEHEAAP
jgi:acyl-CoA thioester hydrolase